LACDTEKTLMAGRKLDQHHPVHLKPGIMATCEECGFMADAGGGQHLPTDEEVPKVDGWLATRAS
jgi:hypothetical protein